MLEYYRLLSSRLDMFRTIHIPSTSLTTSRIKFFHSLDKLVFTYTLNNPGDMIDALSLGVDGFFTDDPGLAKSTIIQNVSY